MNGWAIAALVFAAGCLAVAVWALLERYRYKGLKKVREMEMKRSDEAHERELEKYRKYIEGQKDDLKKSDDVVIHYSNEVDRLTKRVAVVTAERDEAMQMYDRKHEEHRVEMQQMAHTVIETANERNALALQLKEATEARTRARTNRAKPPATAE